MRLMVRLLLFASVVPVVLCHGCYVRHSSFMGFCCLYCVKTGHYNASLISSVYIVFTVDFHFFVLKILTLRIQELVIP